MIGLLLSPGFKPANLILVAVVAGVRAQYLLSHLPWKIRPGERSCVSVSHGGSFFKWIRLYLSSQHYDLLPFKIWFLESLESNLWPILNKNPNLLAYSFECWLACVFLLSSWPVVWVWFACFKTPS